MTYLLKARWALILFLCLTSQAIIAQKNEFFYETIPANLVKIVVNSENKITSQAFDAKATRLVDNGKHKKIKAILASKQSWKEFPKKLELFSNLRELWLSRNQFEEIAPASFSQMKKLVTLNLAHNQLKTLPESIGALKKLAVLALKNNQLVSLPAAIGKLKKLEQLYIDGNPLTTLPPEIGDLKSLEMLVLDNTSLKTLPKEFAKLKKLKTLRLLNVPIDTLPKEMAQMTGLRNVYLKKSQKALGDQFKKMIPSVNLNYY